MNTFRESFPFFSGNRNELSYFDSAATTHKPQSVIDIEKRFLSEEYATVNRGAYSMSAKASQYVEDVRVDIAKFINSKIPENIIFTQGATSAVNLIAYGVEPQISSNDTILVSILEHHSNFVPWQELCKRTGATFKTVDISKNGTINYEDLEKKLKTHKPKLLAITHVSNLLGSVSDVEKIVSLAKKTNTLVVLDGAQSIPHMTIDVQELDIDFLVFSGHKIYGPSGVGVLYGKTKELSKLKPTNFGGGMISVVSKEQTTFADLPNRLEAGTPPISQIVALGEAIKFVSSIGMEKIKNYEEVLFNKLISSLRELDFIDLYGPINEGKKQQAIVSFNLHSVHPHDVATTLDAKGVMLRAGHHCAMPALKFMSLPGTLRVSLGIYNTESDISNLVDALKYARKIFSK